jgi:hypothetical protein
VPDLEVPAPPMREVGGGLRVSEVAAVRPADKLLRLGGLLLQPSRLVHRPCIQLVLDVHIRADAGRQGRRFLGQELPGPPVLLSVEQLHVRMQLGPPHLQRPTDLGLSGAAERLEGRGHQYGAHPVASHARLHADD